MGGVVEEFMEAAEKVSPSAQYRTSPDGEVLDVSTHDQILGGDSGQIYLGCTFPALDGYRLKIRDDGRKPKLGSPMHAGAAMLPYGFQTIAAEDVGFQFHLRS